jgi:hypothetical protein
MESKPIRVISPEGWTKEYSSLGKAKTELRISIKTIKMCLSDHKISSNGFILEYLPIPDKPVRPAARVHKPKTQEEKDAIFDAIFVTGNAKSYLKAKRGNAS